MNKKTIQKAFREWKRKAGADYAITYPDNLGDCMSCVNYALSEKYGEDSKGIFLKHWSHGMNRSGSVENQEQLFIAHDIDESQAVVLYDVFSKYFHVIPEQYDPARCYSLFDKTLPLYEVTYSEEYDGEAYLRSNYFTSEEDAKSRQEFLLDMFSCESSMRLLKEAESEAITFSELRDAIGGHNKEHDITTQFSDSDPLIAVIVYTKDSFDKPYSLAERSYKIRSDNKRFLPAMGGTSLFGDCLDGKDVGVRLDYYMGDWKIDYCYIVKGGDK